MRRRPFLILALLALAVSSRTACALVITPVFDTTITSDPNAAAIESAIQAAIQVYESRFSDPITVTIKFEKMSSGLGASNWWYYTFTYAQFRAALAADASTANDVTALAHLPITSTNPASGTSSVRIKTANIRALGIAGSFPSGLDGGVDGIIGLNTSITNLTRISIDPNKYDLRAVAMHEIDEVLGLASSLDASSSNPLPEDLFRYTSAGARSFTASGDNAYFSIDGVTDLARFNQNILSSGGDYGDWWSCTNLANCPHTAHVQDAWATPGVTPDLGVELTALDVIGYNLVPACLCPADFNCSGTLSVQDIFDFLAAWFAGSPSADFTHVNGVSVQDIFAFLAAWFAGC
jgi:hypothetical protein